MEPHSFVKLVNVLPQLTTQQMAQVEIRLRAIWGLTQVSQHLEQSVRCCPHCGSQEFIHWGRSHGQSRFRCNACYRTFNPLTGTPLVGLRHRERWLTYVRSLFSGQSVRKSARRCGIHPNTAFRWRHRFLKGPAILKAHHLTGIAEVDETFFLRSDKGSRHLTRPPRKRGGHATQRGRSKEHVFVLVARDRSGATMDAVMAELDAEAVTKTLGPLLPEDAVLCSDGLSAYASFCRKRHVVHQVVQNKPGQRVHQGVFHIQNVNAYHSRLKNWMLRFHGVTTHYLENYLGWFRWLDQHGPSPNAPVFLLNAEGRDQQVTVT